MILELDKFLHACYSSRTLRAWDAPEPESSGEGLAALVGFDSLNVEGPQSRSLGSFDFPGMMWYTSSHDRR